MRLDPLPKARMCTAKDKRQLSAVYDINFYYSIFLILCSTHRAQSSCLTITVNVAGMSSDSAKTKQTATYALTEINKIKQQRQQYVY